ncbi:MAG: hypothetical protein KDA05_06590 [Phycisphaerales bacterium]|nr:hypothetical protein [Phycisphaerales bacterium]
MPRTTARATNARWNPAGTRPAGSGPAHRVNDRVAWDHSVLDDSAPTLTWSAADRARQRRQNAQGNPAPLVFAAWVLVAWSIVAGIRLWTLSDLDTHVSMRFLAMGYAEEILGVAIGLLWAATPAVLAFWLARKARIVTLDEMGGWAYWASAVVAVIAGVGTMRALWDEDAGSRFARTSPAGQVDSDADGSLGEVEPTSGTPSDDAFSTGDDDAIQRSGDLEYDADLYHGPVVDASLFDADNG